MLVLPKAPSGGRSSLGWLTNSSCWLHVKYRMDSLPASGLTLGTWVS
jgi:hypothetical protein